MKKVAYGACVIVSFSILAISAYASLSGLWYGFGSFFNSREITGISVGVSATCRNNIVNPCEEINPVSTIAYAIQEEQRRYFPVNMRIAQDVNAKLIYNEKHPNWVRYSTGETRRDIRMIFSQNSQDLIILILMIGGMTTLLSRIKSGLFD